MFVLPMTMASHHALAQEVTITLNPGWTWVSYPRADTLDVTTALQSIPPTEGDVIKSQTFFATYMSGMWLGNLQQLIPGKGLMYQSMNPNAVSFVFGAEPPAPAGVIEGLFTVNENGDQVYFSQGNLQYIGSAATPYWKFADNQWDYFGTTTGQNSESENVDRDLFGWGTSGYNHNNAAYQPWSTSGSYSQYYAYGNSSINLYNQNGQADWGYNVISNGGNRENCGWRTLTIAEWNYVFNTRANAASLFGHGNVNGVNGMIFLPDEWILPEGLSFTSGNSSWINVYSAEQWALMEANGAVFLPAAGGRWGTSVDYIGRGYYWSSSCKYVHNAYYVDFLSGYIGIGDYYSRSSGYSVRLVRNAE